MTTYGKPTPEERYKNYCSMVKHPMYYEEYLVICQQIDELWAAADAKRTKDAARTTQ